MSLAPPPSSCPRILLAGSFAGLLAFAWSVPGSATEPSGTETAYSVAMHVHGSMSEGVGSHETQAREALASDVDVIWWTDHDWRISFFHHASRYSFDAWQEPVSANEPWKPLLAKEKKGTKDIVLQAPDSFVSAQASLVGGAGVYEGAKALWIRGLRNEPDFDSFRAMLTSHRQRHKRTLAADVTLRLAVYPVWNEADARAFVQVDLSDHQDPGGVGVVQHALRYVLDDSGAVPTLADGVYEIPVPFQPGTWNVLELELTADALAGFSGFDPEDNAMFGVTVGVESRNGVEGGAFFDALEILHVLEGDALLQRQQELLDLQELALPGVRHHQGVEVSYMHHLNTFAPQAEVLDHAALAQSSGLKLPSGLLSDSGAYADLLAETAVQRTRDAGGVTSYNHMFGAGHGDDVAFTKEVLLQELLEREVFGAELLEVGYRNRGGHDLAEHLWVWDQLALAGLRLVGTGVNDSHGGAPGHWRTIQNNFVSWVYAASAEKTDLLDGLRAGRVYFGDIGLFDGTVELTSDRGHRMGQVVVTDRSSVDVSLEAFGVAAGDVVTMVDGTGITVAEIAPGAAWQADVTLPLPVGDSFVRFEVTDPDGVAKVLSNPLHFVRAVGTQAVVDDRAALDLAGVVSTSFSGVSLVEASTGPAAGGEELVLDLAVDVDGAGEVHLDLSAAGDNPTVVFDPGLSGVWNLAGDQLSVTQLAGTGILRVRH